MPRLDAGKGPGGDNRATAMHCGTAAHRGLRSGRAHGVHGVLLENIHLTIAAWSNYSAGGGPPCFNEAGDSFQCAHTTTNLLANP